MNRTFLAGAVLFALSVAAGPVLAQPSEEEQAGNEQGEGQGKSPRYEYDPHDRGPYYGALVPPPPETFGKDYPVCSETVKDGCLNPNQLKRMREVEEAERARAENEQGGSERGE